VSLCVFSKCRFNGTTTRRLCNEEIFTESEPRVPKEPTIPQEASYLETLNGYIGGVSSGLLLLRIDAVWVGFVDR
jgi:hypothetical protein